MKGEPGADIAVKLPEFSQINMGRSGSKAPQTEEQRGRSRSGFLVSALPRSALVFLLSLSRRHKGYKDKDILDAVGVNLRMFAQRSFDPDATCSERLAAKSREEPVESVVPEEARW